ncbi:NAD(P)H-binding protein [Rhodoferax sp.]|uniref:NAD(P)H-binding protein n=1 Tax=Rhodoferax sp. TaxID=50421 RepID=UPI001ED50439|nr:NAD(P)H-binding protein [Rhodoferax sp.]MBT9507659.1 NAD(P)H-binding protein [Rhodoferax sp.]
MVVRAAAQAAERVALVAGATGLVGREVLAALLTDKRYTAVHCVGRRSLPVKHPKLVSHVVDLSTLTTLPGIDHIDDVYIALGTTIKVAGSQQAFRAVDFDAVLAVARAAKAAGATRLGVISAMGASANSALFYNRVKGEMEDAVTQLGYEALVIARPSMLAGDRAALHQAPRPGEKMGLFAMMTLFKPLIPANYQAITAKQVAHALLKSVADLEGGKRILLSGEMQSVA